MSVSPLRKPQPPPLGARAKYRPRPGALDELADLVLELLDTETP